MDKTITTSAGYKVILNPFFTYDQFVELQKLWTKDITIDPNHPNVTPQMGAISASIVYEANKMSVGFLVKKIINPDGNEIAREDVTTLPIPAIDGSEVMDEITKISNEASDAFNKKKVTIE
jgi:hypothetical protein